MPTDNDPRTTEQLTAEAHRLMREMCQWLVSGIGDRTVSMTDATEAIHGSSGRGSPRAVKIIETLGQFGYVTITGKRTRTVKLTETGTACGPVPAY